MLQYHAHTHSHLHMHVAQQHTGHSTQYTDTHTHNTYTDTHLPVLSTPHLQIDRRGGTPSPPQGDPNVPYDAPWSPSTHAHSPVETAAVEGEESVAEVCGGSRACVSTCLRDQRVPLHSLRHHTPPCRPRPNDRKWTYARLCSPLSHWQ